MGNERWLPVVGYEGIYEVSDHGRVRNMRGEVRRVAITDWGYEHLGLSKGGVSKDWRVHRLVAMAFVPLIDGKTHVNHINGNKLDNRAANLEWVTKRENEAHANAIGRSHAITNPKRGHKLSVADVAYIRAEYPKGGQSNVLARRFGVHSSYISRVALGLKRERG